MAEFPVVIDPDTLCWVWQGYVNADGYGVITRRNRQMRVHQYTYREFVGQVPQGLEIDHLCRNRSCCNPDHLEAVTHAVNMQRSNVGENQRRKVACPQGHPYSGVNSQGRRICHPCQAAASRRYKEKNTVG